MYTVFLKYLFVIKSVLVMHLITIDLVFILVLVKICLFLFLILIFFTCWLQYCRKKIIHIYIWESCLNSKTLLFSLPQWKALLFRSQFSYDVHNSLLVRIHTGTTLALDNEMVKKRLQNVYISLCPSIS